MHGETSLREIKAYIRPERLDAVVHALAGMHRRLNAGVITERCTKDHAVLKTVVGMTYLFS